MLLTPTIKMGKGNDVEDEGDAPIIATIADRNGNIHMPHPIRTKPGLNDDRYCHGHRHDGHQRVTCFDGLSTLC
jgi:hypothetical protein